MTAETVAPNVTDAMVEAAARAWNDEFYFDQPWDEASEANRKTYRRIMGVALTAALRATPAAADALGRAGGEWERECLRWREKWQDEVGPIIRERDTAVEWVGKLDGALKIAERELSDLRSHFAAQAHTIAAGADAPGVGL